MNETLAIALGGILALLTVATGIVQGLKHWRPERDWQELWLRVRSWWWIVGVFVLAIAVNRALSAGVLAGVSFLAFKEYLTLTPMRRADHLPLLYAYLAIPLQYLWVYQAWYGMFVIFIPVYVYLFLSMRMTLIGQTAGFLSAAAQLHWGLMTTVFCLSHMAYLLVLPAGDSGPGGSVDGAPLLFYLVVLTQLNDIAQYLWGKALGRHKVIPLVSPNKTVEGLLGGVATTTLIGGAMGPYLTPMSLEHSFLAGFLIGIAGFIGDVVMSAMKRDIGVKDTGTLLPGHGGILDRLDSLTYTAPLFFHFLRYLYY
jgi:phosphatidate cytidylyltransferase